MNIETSALTLRTFDINSAANNSVTTVNVPIDNNVGTITANGQVMIWKNVNLRMLLGDMYEKYDKFNIVLTSLMVRAINPTVGGTEGYCSIHLSGLNFSNQTYSCLTNGLTNETIVGVANYNAVNTSVISPLLAGIITFRKPSSDNVNIQIELKNNSMNNTLNGYSEKAVNVIFGHQTYVFDIYGCEGYETSKHHNFKGY